VWEQALARHTLQAVADGVALAHQRGVEFIAIDPAEQQRFDALYRREAGRNAASLARFGIAGAAVLRTARASLAGDGSVTCHEGA
jgi:hypothetical protein